MKGLAEGERDAIRNSIVSLVHRQQDYSFVAGVGSKDAEERTCSIASEHRRETFSNF